MARDPAIEDGDALFYPWVEGETRGKVVVIAVSNARLRERVLKLLDVAKLKSTVFDTAEQLMKCLPSADASCIILDVLLPDETGLKVQSGLGDSAPVIFVTSGADIETAVLAMKRGAVDFLVDPFRNQPLLDAIFEAFRRDGHRRLRRAAEADAAKRFDALTPRERQVMNLVVLGNLTKEIGDRLRISDVTVKAHRKRVLKKMGAGGIADLVHMGLLFGAPWRYGVTRTTFGK